MGGCVWLLNSWAKRRAWAAHYVLNSRCPQSLCRNGHAPSSALLADIPCGTKGGVNIMFGGFGKGGAVGVVNASFFQALACQA